MKLASIVAGIKVENQAYRVSKASQFKTLLTFDESLSRLQKAGFTRHLRASELVKIIHKIQKDRKKYDIKRDLWKEGNYMNREGDCEWLSLAFEKNNNTLTVYKDPKGLVYTAANKRFWYKEKDFGFSEKAKFTLSIDEDEYEGLSTIIDTQYINIDLKCANRELVEYIFEEKLPELLKATHGRNQFYTINQKHVIFKIPYDDFGPTPVSRKLAHHAFVIGFSKTAGSRGVKD